MEAPLPPDEAQRLAALRRYAVLDTLPEEAFDRLTRLAAQLLGVPVALVSFVDADRQWFKSRRGLDLGETPRRVAFCAHTILSDEVLVVEDARADPRFAGNPLVTGPAGVRHYAGAPVTTPDGYRIGTLCAIDRSPRSLTPEQACALKDLAALVADELELRRQAAERGRAEAVLRAAVESLPFEFWMRDREHRCVLQNPASRALRGDRIGTRPEELGLPPGVAERWRLEGRRALAGEIVRDEAVEVLAGGAARTIEKVIAPVRDQEGVFGYVGISIDVTERRRAEERMRHLALHDALTGLANRTLFLDRLGQALAHARREGSRVAVLLLDLDDFKGVNDALGHAAGDRLLHAVAARLGRAVRASDTLARLGGDEFAIVQLAVRGSAGAATLAHKLVDALAAPFAPDGQEMQVSASVGIAGLERDEFALVYQPQIDLRTGRVSGVEALVRWHHPERGLVPPSEFIPVAETSGLIVPLGGWVLREACRQGQAWRAEGLVLTIAVNVSPVQLHRPDAPTTVDEALRASGLAPGLLELEITEGLLVELGVATDGRLAALAARGVRLAIDDFGTGYSSLAYLKRLPVQRIKIDRSFVRDIGADPEDEAVVRAIVSLGRTLGKRVVAEGVESQAQLAFLRQLGCDAAQGFLLGRPQAASGIGRLLAG